MWQNYTVGKVESFFSVNDNSIGEVGKPEPTWMRYILRMISSCLLLSTVVDSIGVS